MRAIDLLGGTEIVSEQDCWDMLATGSIGRIALFADGQVEIFPVNYGLDGDGIVFRTNAGRKMAGVASGEVAFEVDSVDPESRCGWSVVVHGTARDITGHDGPARQLAARPWTGSKDFLVRISARSVTGRRVLPQSSRA
jgi:nitroimidazol reductase NimA-like FMN-containing flavoprotein (pyridoxamine 5'-phosphate oxidase superfamily)